MLIVLILVRHVYKQDLSFGLFGATGFTDVTEFGSLTKDPRLLWLSNRALCFRAGTQECRMNLLKAVHSGPKDRSDVRILQAMVSGITLVLGL